MLSADFADYAGQPLAATNTMPKRRVPEKACQKNKKQHLCCTDAPGCFLNLRNLRNLRIKHPRPQTNHVSLIRP